MAKAIPPQQKHDEFEFGLGLILGGLAGAANT